MKRSFLIVLIGIVVLTSCSQTSVTRNGSTSVDDSFGPRLWSYDHRFLDTLQPTAALLGELAEEHSSLLYALGRSYEGRSRNEAALKVYEFVTKMGMPPWDGFSAVRGAAIAAGRGDLLASLAWSERAIESQPENWDGWWYHGSALYQLEEYDRLLDFIETIPGATEFSHGFTVDRTGFFEEVAVWRAVAAFVTSGETDPFVDAFVFHPAGEIHSRLYLYLYYRDGALQQFQPAERTLLEAVFRIAEGQRGEGLRLLLAVSATDFYSWTIRLLNTAGGEGPLPGLFGSIDNAFVAQRSGVTRWFEGLRDYGDSLLAAETVTIRQTFADLFRVLEARPAIAASADHSLTALSQVFSSDSDSDSGGDINSGDPRDTRSAIRLLARDRYLDLRISRGDTLTSVVTAMGGASFTPDEYARVVDRLLPAIVTARHWEVLPSVLSSVPGDAKEARGHIEYVMGVVAENALFNFDEPELQDRGFFLEASTRQEIDYFHVSAAALNGTPLVSFDAEEIIEKRSGLLASADPITVGESDRGDPAYRALMYADALVTAGRIDEALRIAMNVAQDAAVAPAARLLARRFSALGHYSAALDLMRRAYARGDLVLRAADVEVLYPPAYQSEIEAAAERNNVGVAILNGLVREESHFRPIAQSHVGAQGLAQLMPATADDMARRLNRVVTNLDNPEENLQLGAFYLDYLADEVPEPILRVAAYNAGLGRGRRWTTEFGDLPPRLQVEALPFIETRWYVRRIAVSASVYQWLRDGSSIETAFEAFLRGDL